MSEIGVCTHAGTVCWSTSPSSLGAGLARVSPGVYEVGCTSVPGAVHPVCVYQCPVCGSWVSPPRAGAGGVCWGSRSQYTNLRLNRMLGWAPGREEARLSSSIRHVSPVSAGSAASTHAIMLDPSCSRFSAPACCAPPPPTTHLRRAARMRPATRSRLCVRACPATL